VLTPQEIRKLFKIMGRMREQGKAVVFISHKLNEVREMSDRITVLHKGRTVATVDTASLSADALIELMVGRKVDLAINRPRVVSDGVCLRVENLTVQDIDGVKKLDEVSFELNHGEILGVAGLAGSGQKELCETIAGLINPLRAVSAFMIKI
jgi:simple sugar transport system ATP-binding protein